MTEGVALRVVLVVSVTLILVGAAALSGIGARASREVPMDPAAKRAVAAHVAAARAIRVSDSIDVRGQVVPSQLINVRSEVDGRIVRSHFREGTWVNKGDLLFEVEPRLYAARVNVAESEVQKARAALAVWRKGSARTGSLVRDGFLSQSAMDEASASGDQLQAQLDNSLAALEIARIGLERTRIRAPISGRAGKRLVDEGTAVRAADGATLVEIARTDPVYVAVSLPEDRLDRITAVSRALPADILALDGGPLTTANVSLIANAIERSTATVEVRLTAPNPDGKLWPGKSVVARIFLSAEMDAIVVPEAAIFRGNLGDAVYVVGTDSTAALRRIVVKRSGSDGVQVEGLAAGERVVISGHAGVSPGARVAPAEPLAQPQ
jgi:membrane fusion protein, multidrug efflux system